MKRIQTAVALLASIAGPCVAEATWKTGHINNITVAVDDVLVKLDSGLPDNCTSTAFGWLLIPSSAKATKAFVLALWARGDMSSTVVTIYTTAGVVGNYCHVDQIDPIE